MPDSTSKPIKLLVVIINYFSADLVISLVKQLCEQPLPTAWELSIVCADNSASNEQRAKLEKIITRSSIEFKLILNSRNHGFGNAINRCVESEKFDYLCCINPDVTLRPETISTLLNHCSTHPEQGVWGGLTVDNQQQPDFRHAWQEPSLKNTFAWATGLSRVLGNPSWQDDYSHLGVNAFQPYPVDCVSGCCLLVANTVWQTTSGFDTEFFLYSEEVDLCRRAKVEGFQPTVIPKALLAHSTHATNEANERISTIYSSKLLYAAKHHNLLYNACYRTLISLGASLRAIKYFTIGNFHAAKIWAQLTVNALSYQRPNFDKNHSE